MPDFTSVVLVALPNFLDADRPDLRIISELIVINDVTRNEAFIAKCRNSSVNVVFFALGIFRDGNAGDASIFKNDSVGGKAGEQINGYVRNFFRFDST